MPTCLLMRAGLLTAGCLSLTDTAAADWMQWGYDAAHSANNPDESAITSANVASLTLRYRATLPDAVDSAPVFAAGIVTASGTRDLLFLTAQNSNLLAVDAATGAVVWAKTTANTTTESSPAIDPNRQFVYSYGGDGKVHKYAIGTGVETTGGGWPQVATLKPSVEKGAGAIAIATSGSNHYLYVVNDGYYGDGGDYQGHVTTINLVTGAQKVFNSLCSDLAVHMTLNGPPTTDCEIAKSGIWGRPGATYDAATNRMYVTTGNGNFNANMGGFNWGDSVLALKPDGTGAGAGLPLDSFTPANYSDLDGSDVDLGSASLSILPVAAGSTVQHLGLQTGKDSMLHLIDLDDMSGTGAPGGVGGEVQLLPVPVSEYWMKTQPAIWVDSTGDGATWVFIGNGSGLSGLKLIYSSIHEPSLLPTWTSTSAATSAIVANGILYHAGFCGGGGICMIARNPRDGSVLWSSPTYNGLSWKSPILVNGALYFAGDYVLNRFDLGMPGASDLIFQNGFETSGN